MTLFTFLDYASVLVFALTGALVASRAQLDIVGFCFFACLTAVGGGTLRDVLLDRNPVFWLERPSFLGVACGAALLVFFTAHLFESRYRLLLWLDAFALSVSVSAGSGIALSLGQPAPVVLVMGIITGCMGGIMRDTVSNEVPLVLKQGELYVTCTLAGSLATVVASHMGLPPSLVALACAMVTFILRAGSMTFGWTMPAYKSRPPKV
ncbi:trimeric intracellular cation channel family protein [Halocynthiibacter namhaensis]|uniref:trimeric intracellular cation channel family protein n=1 Tax=Halocynthiibacter namhaensis TaxID=1290553 RepID=UPI0005790618|nr:trimeric intracellular cation channel family protein [Halocynthiibacter namhaensis]